MSDLTVVFYTSNYMEGKPFFERVIEHLQSIIVGLPIVSVSQRPMRLGKNICVGDVGRSHLNIYRQILVGCRTAKTKYVAMAEDDILYSAAHFQERCPSPGKFLYDMHKWSVFTWTDPPLFNLRRRKVVNHLIAERDVLVEALEERFRRHNCLEFGSPDPPIRLGIWGDPGRHEQYLGVTVRPTEEFYASVPGIVFSHPDAYGYTSRGERKSLGKEKTDWLPDWGTAAEIMKKYYDCAD